MGLFDRKIYIEKIDFAQIIASLVRTFETSREEYFLGSILQLKREGYDVSNISREIAPKSELEDALKAFQLTSMMGIAYDHIRNIDDQLEFDKSLSLSMNSEEGSRAWSYRDKYLDCRGDMLTLTKTFSKDIYRLIGSPEPRIEFLIQFQAGAQLFIGMCQVATHSACGDEKMAMKLKKRMGIVK